MVSKSFVGSDSLPPLSFEALARHVTAVYHRQDKNILRVGAMSIMPPWCFVIRDWDNARN